MNIRTSLKLPKEHGAWAMLYVPFVLGAIVGGDFGLPIVLLLLAVTALFIARESLLVWWRAHNRRRTTDNARQAGRLLLFYGAIAVTSGIPLLLVYRLYWLLPLALLGCILLAVNGKQATEFADRSVASEVMAIIGLTMTAPAAYLAARGQNAAVTLWLWALSAAYFASSVFYVKLRVTGLHAKRPKDKQRARWQCVGYHAFLLLSLLALAVTRSLPLFALIAFAPVLARTTWSLFKPTETLNLKHIGLSEIAYALIFLLFTTLTFRLAT
ncbi:MAG: YwiC-like family protein [Acidobacteria bacterium]|nr:YwiC-like family protein [Acidobacteriota bacterium]